MISSLRISLIRLDGGTQTREALHHDRIDEYAGEMATGAEFPPVIVFYDGTDYWCADGFHRVEAARRAERDAISAEVRQGTRRDAILYSVGANAKHGIPRSNADKRRAVMTLLNDEEWSKCSDRWIAEKCAVSNHLVADLRLSNGNSPSSNISRLEEKRQAKDGRQMSQPLPKQKSPKVEPPEPDPAEESEPEEEPDDPQPITPARPRAEEKRPEPAPAPKPNPTLPRFELPAAVSVSAIERLQAQRDEDPDFAALRRMDRAISEGPLGNRACRMRDFILDGGEIALLQLGLDWTVTVGTLNAAFKTAAVALHPDRGGNAQAFAALVRARDLVRRIV